MKKIVFILGFLITSMTFAQTSIVEGNILDGELGEAPLAFASIQVKGLDIGTESDLDGSYELALLEGEYTFVIDFIGYKSIEIANVKVADKKVILSPVALQALRPSYDLVASE